MPDSNERSRYSSVSLRQGPFMRVQEDRFLIAENNPSISNYSLYAVFDGHAGYQAAEFCKDKIVDKLHDELQSSKPVSKQIKAGKSLVPLKLI
jgi:serine/threonine protein phosphatase PrpC